MTRAKLRNFIYSQKWLVRGLIGIFIRLHNYSYKKITEYSSVLNRGENPKHDITQYHKYFVDRIDRDDIVLDIGCGGGLLADDVARKAKKVVGIDITSRNIDYAVKNHSRKNLQFIIGDATTYPFSGRFNKLILSNVLEHIKDRPALLKKISKLGDTLLLRVPMINRDWTVMYKKNNGFEYRLDDTHYIEYTLEDVEKEAEASGWIIESYQVNWGEFWGVLKRK